MGSKYRNRGARAVVSALLATGLGLSVMVMAPAANAVEVPGCENIGQPGVKRRSDRCDCRYDHSFLQSEECFTATIECAGRQ